jgi:AcrR family transcriptional regulator
MHNKRSCTSLDAAGRARLSSATDVAGDDSERRGSSGPGGTEGERDRLIAAFGKAASEHGYRDLTLDQVAHYAGLSRARYEAHFDTKEQGLVAAQDVFLDRLWLDALAACEAPDEWPAKVRAALRVVISSLGEASTLARVFAVEATAASFAAAERQFALLEQFASLLREGRRRYPRAASLPPPTERLLIGGVASIVCEQLLAENPAAIFALEPQLLESLLIPFLGEGEAKRAAAG